MLLVCLLSTEELNPSQVVRTLLPLLLESSTESVAEISSTSLERILGPSESDAFLARIYERLVTGCYNIIANHSDPNRYAMCDMINHLTYIKNIFVINIKTLCGVKQVFVVLNPQRIMPHCAVLNSF